jgi:hypothetical protein
MTTRFMSLLAALVLGLGLAACEETPPQPEAVGQSAESDPQRVAVPEVDKFAEERAERVPEATTEQQQQAQPQQDQQPRS